jgi:hypothetical protein
VHTGRQAECDLRLPPELQVQRVQCRAEAERSRRQQHILHRRIDGRAGRAGRGAAFEARDDPDGSLVNAQPDIPPLRAAAESAPGSCQGPVHQPDIVAQPARPRHACNKDLDRFLDLRIADYQEAPALVVS